MHVPASYIKLCLVMRGTSIFDRFFLRANRNKEFIINDESLLNLQKEDRDNDLTPEKASEISIEFG